MLETKFLIVDGNSLACRAAFAHNPKNGPDLCNSDGIPTGAIFRFMNMFDRILHQIRPTHIVVAWDMAGTTFRKEIYPEYKANRQKNNDTIIKSKDKSYSQEDIIHIQFEQIRNILEAIGIKNVSVPRFEGDDIVGTYVNLSEADKNFIITGDRDSFQLVDDNTVVVFPLNGFKEIQIITPEYIKEKYSVETDKFVDLKALMGDTGDNIKGIDGCGEKTAVKLLEHFGSAENVSWNTEESIKGINKKVMANIKEWANRFDIVMKLVTIRKDVPVPFSFDDCEVELDWDEAEDYFKELDFKALLSRLRRGEFYGQRPFF